MKTGVFIGRFQPFHDGHAACIRRILNENDYCVVLVRDTRIGPRNPLTMRERWESIRAAFPDAHRVSIRPIPDLDADLTVYIGRDVGYELIKLDETTEAISATNIRAELYKGRQA